MTITRRFPQKGTDWIAYYDAVGDMVRLASVSGGNVTRKPLENTQQGELPQVAVSPDGNDVWIAWYDHVNLDLLVGEYGVKTPPAFTLVKPSEVPVGGKASAPSTATCSPSGSTVSVVAPVGASGTGFEQTCYAASAKQAFTITFDNKDTSITHNFAVYDTQGGKYIFGAEPTQLVTGPGTATYKVTPQAPGTYYFQCDVHPTTMNGTFVVK